jgi:IS605 OrfB family transposase
MGKRKTTISVDDFANVRTFQMRFHGDFPQLDDLAKRYNDAKHLTYSMARKQGVAFTALKSSDELAKFRLPARLHNAIAIDLAGMVKSIQQKSMLDADAVADKLLGIEKVYAKLDKQIQERQKQTSQPNFPWGKFTELHRQRQRKKEVADRLDAKQQRLAAVAESKFPSICFGSRKRFNAQHHLKDNGYDSHYEWRADWRDARADQFLVVGSADEDTGNKTCRATIGEDGLVSLALQLVEGRGTEKLILLDLRLPHGHEEWLTAITNADAECEVSRRWQAETARLIAEMKGKGEWSEAAEKELRTKRRKEREKQAKIGAAITYRFVKDKYGWRLLVSVPNTARMPKADFSGGAFGIDLNDNHLAVVQVDANGKLISYTNLPMVMYGKSSGQRLALLHDLAMAVVQQAYDDHLPICIEKLDFSGKKKRLREIGNDKAARRLSSFAYSRFAAILLAHAKLKGVAVVFVEPAYTSVIGAAVHAVPNGVSVHGGAAMAIARRAMALQEVIPARMRLFNNGRRPLLIKRPDSLRSKAWVDPWWTGWRDLAKAVHVAREQATIPRLTGSQRRRKLRLSTVDVIPY